MDALLLSMESYPAWMNMQRHGERRPNSNGWLRNIPNVRPVTPLSNRSSRPRTRWSGTLHDQCGPETGQQIDILIDGVAVVTVDPSDRERAAAFRPASGLSRLSAEELEEAS
jgi:hypothetical protein